MSSKYAEAHKTENLKGPGDARPTGLQIIEDNNLTNALADKVAIVTGASSGIGIETGRALAATGAKVFLAVRDLKKGEAACADFLSPGRVELLEMDNNSLASVRAAAQTFLSKSDKLNILVNNAGIMATPEGKTKDGFESQFGTNHLAHFLFFNLLKDTLIKSSTPEFGSRVVNVSSMGHLWGSVQFGNYGFEDGSYNPWSAYAQSKLSNIYMANHITSLYGKEGVQGLSLHPGGIWTGLQQHLPKETVDSWKAPEIMRSMKSPAQGSATTIFAAVDKSLEGKGRLYLDDCAVVGPVTGPFEIGAIVEGHSLIAFDEEKEALLWKDSLKMVGLA